MLRVILDQVDTSLADPGRLQYAVKDAVEIDLLRRRRDLVAVRIVCQFRVLLRRSAERYDAKGHSLKRTMRVSSSTSRNDSKQTSATSRSGLCRHRCVSELAHFAVQKCTNELAELGWRAELAQERQLTLDRVKRRAELVRDLFFVVLLLSLSQTKVRRENIPVKRMRAWRGRPGWPSRAASLRERRCQLTRGT